MGNYEWIATQIEDYHNSLIENRLKYIGLPPEKKQELWKMLGGVK